MSQHVSDSPAPTGLSRLSRISPSRRSLLLGAAAAAPIVALGAGSASALGGYRDAGGLHITHEWIHEDIRSVDFRFDTGGQVQTFPPSLRVTVPAGYDENLDRHYPVVLLLHGGGGMYQDWTNHGNVIEQTEKHEAIVVMPDGGGGSFYSNANFPRAGLVANWETFIMEMVLPFVHANFRTAPDRMAIAGLSMGGFGALALGQRYWGHFRSVSSYSGPADCGATPHGLLVGTLIMVSPLGDVPRYGLRANGPGAIWGLEPYPQIARGYNPMENIETYRDKRVFLRTGNGPLLDLLGFDGMDDLVGEYQSRLAEFGMDVQENVVMHTQESFSNALSDAGIEHDFRVDDGETHEWGLWNRSFAEDLPGMMKVLNS